LVRSCAIVKRSRASGSDTAVVTGDVFLSHPHSDPASDWTTARSLELVPYEAAKLRTTASPYLRERSHCGSTASRIGIER